MSFISPCTELASLLKKNNYCSFPIQEERKNNSLLFLQNCYLSLYLLCVSIPLTPERLSWGSKNPPEGQSRALAIRQTKGVFAGSREGFRAELLFSLHSGSSPVPFSPENPKIGGLAALLMMLMMKAEDGQGPPGGPLGWQWQPALPAATAPTTHSLALTWFLL